MFHRHCVISLCTLAICLGAVRPAVAVEEDGPSRRSFENLDDRPIKAEEPGDIASVAGQDQTCETVATARQSFPTELRLRGNVYRVESPGVLLRYCMELNFTGTTDLYFTILRRPVSQELLPFTRHPQLPDDHVVRTVGLGRRLYCTTGEFPPLTLQAGQEYLIGIAWGQVSIGNFRDMDLPGQYPRPFSHGRTLGLVSRFLTAGEEPPLNVPPGGLENIFLDSSAANLMQLCFVPEPGACCCVGDSGCDELLQRDCDDIGGFFRGERVVCDPGLCRCGACCRQCAGECLNDVEEAACQLQFEGDWQGRGSQCLGIECPVVTGACCIGATCREICNDECDILGGVFRATETCTPVNPCRGACCDEQATECIDVTNGTCTDIGGTPHPHGSSCATLEGVGQECGGACCRPNGRCSDVSTRLRCESELNGNYLGDATVCPTRPDDHGAFCVGTFAPCCIHNGDCLMTTQEFCEDASWIGGVFFSDEPACDPSLCEGLDLGACCYTNGSCDAPFSQPDCVHSGGSFRGAGSVCFPNTCPAPRGGCCLPNGTCRSNQTVQQCEGLDGAYRGDNSICSSTLPCPGPEGACCFEGRPCERLSASACAAEGGAYRGDGVSCIECPTVAGACCLPNGECVARSPAICAVQKGVYQGDDVACSSVKCPQPMGACCFASDGSCVVMAPTGCASAGGNYLGNDTNCQPNVCPQPTGACCFAVDGRCALVTEAACAAAGGEYEGNGMPCTPNPCPQPRGACCFDDGRPCRPETQIDCTGAGGTYQGHNTTCSPALCPSACCFAADGRCELRTAAACMSAGGMAQAPDTSCTPNPCPQPTGACCFPDGTCQVLTETECGVEAGTYEGNNTACEPNDCPQPDTNACCFDNGACQDLTANACEKADGVFLGGNYPTCEVDTCDPLPTGACCQADGDCTVSDRPACRDGGGIFQGAFTDCDPNECPQPMGACCFADARECSVLTDEDCATQGGTLQGNGTTCSPSPCIRACCFPNGSCDDLNQITCEAGDGTYQPDVPGCGGDLICPIATGACCMDAVCSLRARMDCETNGGEYRGDGSDCQPNACIEIVSALPANNEIDPLQPSELDGTGPTGWLAIVLTMSGDATGAMPADFDVAFSPPLVDMAPSVKTVEVNGPMATLTLSSFIPPGRWTQFTYLPSDSSTCVGFLPGDVLSNRLVNADDVNFLTMCLDNPDEKNCLPQPQHRDTDRSRAVNPQDLARLMDLFNGAHAYRAWLGETLGRSPCDPALGACCVGEACSAQTEAECAAAGGVYRGDGMDCQPSTCLGLIGAEPESGVIDARQPSEPDGAMPATIEVMLTFTGSTAGFSTTDFSVAVTGGSAPTLAAVVPSGNDVLLQFAPGGIPVGHWLEITHTASTSSVCMGFLPADVSGDGTANSGDIVALTACLDVPGSCELHECDLDRSGECEPHDLVRGIDLLNGLGIYDNTIVSLPASPCE